VGSDPDPRRAGGEHELGLWQLLVAGQVVVWALLAAVGWLTLRNFKRSVPTPASMSRAQRQLEMGSFVVFVIAAALLLLALQWLAGLQNPTILPGQQWKNLVLHSSLWSRLSRSW
jgi:hypothetical protein